MVKPWEAMELAAEKLRKHSKQNDEQGRPTITLKEALDLLRYKAPIALPYECPLVDLLRLMRKYGFIEMEEALGRDTPIVLLEKVPQNSG